MFQVIWRRNLACLAKEWIAVSITIFSVQRVTGMPEKPATFPTSLSSPHLMLCFVHWSSWGQPDMMHSTSLNGCFCHPRYNNQEGKGADFPFFFGCYASWVPAPWCNKLEAKSQGFWDLTLVTYCSYWATPVQCQQGLLGFMSGCVFHSSWQ